MFTFLTLQNIHIAYELYGLGSESVRIKTITSPERELN